MRTATGVCVLLQVKKEGEGGRLLAGEAGRRYFFGERLKEPPSQGHQTGQYVASHVAGSVFQEPALRWQMLAERGEREKESDFRQWSSLSKGPIGSPKPPSALAMDG